jgi:DNA (cytosine-5)-methyltransferase 1
VIQWPAEVASTLNAHYGDKQGKEVQCVAFSCKDHGADAGVVSPTLRSMGHDGSHANGGGQVAVAFGWQNSSQQGASVSEHCSPTLDKSKTPAVAIAMRGRDGGAIAEVGDDCAFTLRAAQGGGDKPHVMCESLYNKGFTQGDKHASAQEANTRTLLRELQEAIGEEAFAKWGLGILDSLQSPEILRQALHGGGIRPAAFSRSWVVYCALSRTEDGPTWLLQSLREAGCQRCASQGWQPSKQLSGELGAYLSELSQPGAQASRFMRDLWWSAQRAGVLREALSAVQEVGRSAYGQGQPTYGPMQVRRLTPEECEFLQGFPRGYTDIRHGGKATPDGPRYKALGNSMAIPPMRWIGQRIAMVDSIQALQVAA